MFIVICTVVFVNFSVEFGQVKNKLTITLKVLFHCTVQFRATCLATQLRDKLHESLPKVTFLLKSSLLESLTCSVKLKNRY